MTECSILLQPKHFSGPVDLLGHFDTLCHNNSFKKNIDIFARPLTRFGRYGRIAIESEREMNIEFVQDFILIFLTFFVGCRFGRFFYQRQNRKKYIRHGSSRLEKAPR